MAIIWRSITNPYKSQRCFPAQALTHGPRRPRLQPQNFSVSEISPRNMVLRWRKHEETTAFLHIFTGFSRFSRFSQVSQEIYEVFFMDWFKAKCFKDSCRFSLQWTGTARIVTQEIYGFWPVTSAIGASAIKHCQIEYPLFLPVAPNNNMVNWKKQNGNYILYTCGLNQPRRRV